LVAQEGGVCTTRVATSGTAAAVGQAGLSASKGLNRDKKTGEALIPNLKDCFLYQKGRGRARKERRDGPQQGRDVGTYRADVSREKQCSSPGDIIKESSGSRSGAWKEITQ